VTRSERRRLIVLSVVCWLVLLAWTFSDMAAL